jgi:hypothetical protein
MTNSSSSHKWRGVLLRFVLTAIALGIWFWTQSLISRRAVPAGVGDALHTLTAGLNAYFYSSPAAANALLILSSALIDGLGLFLLGRWLFGPTVRPFLGLVLLLGLRQIMQAICALPPPPNMIWHYPGFPSLLVTYNVGDDFSFRGIPPRFVLGNRTRISRRLTAIAVGIVLAEMAAVLILRALHHGRFCWFSSRLCVARFYTKVRRVWTARVAVSAR